MTMIYLVVAFDSESTSVIRGYMKQPAALAFVKRCEDHDHKRPPYPPDGDEWGESFDKWEAANNRWAARHPAKGHHYYNQFRIQKTKLFP